MSWKFKSAIYLPLEPASPWSKKDISQEVLSEIYIRYKEVYLILTNEYVEGEVYVMLEDLPPNAKLFPNRLQDYLDMLGDQSLITTNCIPNTDVGFVHYEDARKSNYKIELINAGVVTIKNTSLTSLNDLVITRPMYSTDITRLHTQCLITVNGYHHFTDTDGQGAFVYEGAKSLRVADDNNLGIFDFSAVGTITKTLIKNLNPRPAAEGTKLHGRVIIDSPVSLEGKSPILVLGGYLVFLKPEVFWVSGDKEVTLNMERIPLLERYFESKEYLDLSSLGIKTLEVSKDTIDVSQLYSDETIMKYLSMSQSFLVLVNKERIFTKEHYVRHYNLPGQFTSYQEPTMPMITGFGRSPEYWKTKEMGYWEIRYLDSFRRSYLYDTTRRQYLKYVSGAMTNPYQVTYSMGSMLEIGAYDTTNMICKK